MKTKIEKYGVRAGAILAFFVNEVTGVCAETTVPTIDDTAIVNLFNAYFWQIYGIYAGIIGGVAIVSIAKIAPKYQLGDPEERQPKEFFKQALMIGGIAFIVLLLPTLLKAMGIM